VFSGLFDRLPHLKILTCHIGAMFWYFKRRALYGLEQLASPQRIATIREPLIVSSGSRSITSGCSTATRPRSALRAYPKFRDGEETLR
jgi:hypothetical protein